MEEFQGNISRCEWNSRSTVIWRGVDLRRGGNRVAVVELLFPQIHFAKPVARRRIGFQLLNSFEVEGARAVCWADFECLAKAFLGFRERLALKAIERGCERLAPGARGFFALRQANHFV